MPAHRASAKPFVERDPLNARTECHEISKEMVVVARSFLISASMCSPAWPAQATQQLSAQEQSQNPAIRDLGKRMSQERWGLISRWESRLLDLADAADSDHEVNNRNPEKPPTLVSRTTNRDPGSPTAKKDDREKER